MLPWQQPGAPPPVNPDDPFLQAIAPQPPPPLPFQPEPPLDLGPVPFGNQPPPPPFIPPPVSPELAGQEPRSFEADVMGKKQELPKPPPEAQRPYLPPIPGTDPEGTEGPPQAQRGQVEPPKSNYEMYVDAKRREGEATIKADEAAAKARESAVLKQSISQGLADDAYNRAAMEARAKRQRLMAEADEIANTPTDKQRFRRDAGVSGQLGMVIAAIAGGLLAPFNGGKNSGLDAINNIIERDLQAQEADRANRTGMLKTKVGLLDQDQAQGAADYDTQTRNRLAAYQMTMNAIQAQRDAAGSEAARAHLDQALIGMAMTRDAEAAAAEAAAQQQGFENNLATYKAKTDRSSVAVQHGRLALDRKEAEEKRTQFWAAYGYGAEKDRQENQLKYAQLSAQRNGTTAEFEKEQPEIQGAVVFEQGPDGKPVRRIVRVRNAKAAEKFAEAQTNTEGFLEDLAEFEYSDDVAVMYRRLRFGPPNVRLATRSGSTMRPSNVPSRSWQWTASPALVQMRSFMSMRRPS